MQCGQSVQLLNVKLVVHHVTSRLYKRLILLYLNLSGLRLWLKSVVTHKVTVSIINDYDVTTSRRSPPPKRIL